MIIFYRRVVAIALAFGLDQLQHWKVDSARSEKIHTFSHTALLK